MKVSEIKEGSTYDNGSKGKWNAHRRVDKIEDETVYFIVVAGRDPGRKGSVKLQSMAVWAVREVRQGGN